MISFICPNCKSSYRFPEKGAGDKFPCGRCGQRLQVPPPPARPHPGPSPNPATVLGVVPGVPAPAARPVAAGPAVPRPDPKPVARAEKKWYYEYQDAAVGPVAEKDLRVAAENDTLKPDARVWTEGMADWQPAVAVLPRAFEGRDGHEAPWGVLRVMAVVLATVAVASVLGLGGVYAFKGRKGDANKSDVAKADAPANPPKWEPPKVETKAPAANTDPKAEPVKPDPPKVEAKVPVAKADPKLPDPGSKVEPKPDPKAPADLTAAQILTRFGPSVAFVDAEMSTGSGFLMPNGFVVTNSHVVEKALSGKIRVSFPSSPNPNEFLEAALVYEDRPRDLAVLEVKSKLPALKLTSDVTIGEDVVVIGSPGTGRTVAKNHITRGILGSVDDNTFAPLKFFITDAAVNGGNSGGPAFNSRGEILGVATLKIGNENMNYLVPYEDVDRALQKSKTVTAAELAALGRRHDAKAVAIRLMAGVLIHDDLHGRYVAAMAAAIEAKRDPAPTVKALQDRYAKAVQAQAGVAITPEVLAAANRLAGVGAGAADAEARPDLRKAIALYEECERLTAGPNEDTPTNYRRRYNDTSARFNELKKTLPKVLGSAPDVFGRVTHGLHNSLGVAELRPDR